MKRLAFVAVAVSLLAGCGGEGSEKVSARSPEVQGAVEDEIKQTVRLNSLATGTQVAFLVVRCIPESDTKLSCIVSASIDGQQVQVPWEGIIDPDSGRFNVYSTG